MRPAQPISMASSFLSEAVIHVTLQARQEWVPVWKIWLLNFLRTQLSKPLFRKGKGVMPAQTPDRMDDGELESLVGYLRTLDFSK